jgi:hypothetical protein
MRVGRGRVGDGRRIGGEQGRLFFGRSRAAVDVVPTARTTTEATGAAAAAVLVRPSMAGSAGRYGSTTAAIEVLPEATLIRRKPLLADARFYLNLASGVVPAIGGAPTFTRASSGQGYDATGREITALPNTPRFRWEDLTGSGLRRGLLWMEPAHMVGAVLQAADKLSYADGPGAEPIALYLRHRAYYDTGTTGVLARLGNPDGTPPSLLVYHTGGTIRAQLHNGAAAAEASFGIAPASGDLVEVLAWIDDETDLLEVVVAIDEEVIGTGSVALPAGGLPADWSQRIVSLSGDAQPTSAAYAEAKVLYSPGFGTGGPGRIQEAREFLVGPGGELVSTMEVE